jgi:hypothetical protein
MKTATETLVMCPQLREAGTTRNWYRQKRFFLQKEHETGNTLILDFYPP